jgi:hypothetical protein
LQDPNPIISIQKGNDRPSSNYYPERYSVGDGIYVSKPIERVTQQLLPAANTGYYGEFFDYELERKKQLEKAKKDILFKKAIDELNSEDDEYWNKVKEIENLIYYGIKPEGEADKAEDSKPSDGAVGAKEESKKEETKKDPVVGEVKKDVKVGEVKKEEVKKEVKVGEVKKEEVKKEVKVGEVKKDIKVGEVKKEVGCGCGDGKKEEPKVIGSNKDVGIESGKSIDDLLGIGIAKKSE